jgi:FMN phosphatase YigB (HAD superfamily)
MKKIRKSPSRGVVAIDLDDTILDTTRLKRDLFLIIEKLGVSFGDAYLRYKNIYGAREAIFNLRFFGKALFGKNNPKVRSLEARFKKLFLKPKKYNPRGIEGFLTALSKRYTLILVTYGDPKLQKKKIAQAKIEKFFYRVYISKDSYKSGVLKNLKKTYGERLLFIDDAKKAIKTASNMNISTIRISPKRKDFAYYSKVIRRVRAVLK